MPIGDPRPIPEPRGSPALFGDLLARARRHWIAQMAAGLGARGYTDYRRADAGVLRLLRQHERSIGELGGALGVTRQAARHVVDGLEARGYATSRRHEGDSRRVVVVLTPSGRRYARAVTDVVEALNRELTEGVDPVQLEAARAVLRQVLRVGLD